MSSLTPQLNAPTVADVVRVSRSISRREIAEDRAVWIATCAMVWVIGFVQLAVALLIEATPSQVALTALVFVFAVVISRRDPPPATALANHVVLGLISFGVILSLCGPGAPTGLIGAMFIGPLYAVRLTERRWLALHVGGFTLVLWALGLLSAAGVAAVVDPSMGLAMLLLGVAPPVLAFSCMATLEAAEAQGDELERLVRRDALTGIGNRRLLLEVLDTELARHERQGKAMSIVVLDLNDFKALNDTHGHAAGDEVLRDVARALEQVAAPRDTLVRQGGDEFCVVLPETATAQVPPMVNAIRAAMTTIETPNGPLTAGTGWATFPTDGDSVDVLLHVADERLRANKPASRPARGPADSGLREPRPRKLRDEPPR